MSDCIECPTCGEQVEIDDYEGTVEVYECANSQCPYQVSGDRDTPIPVDIYMSGIVEHDDDEDYHSQ